MPALRAGARFAGRGLDPDNCARLSWPMRIRAGIARLLERAWLPWLFATLWLLAASQTNPALAVPAFAAQT